MATLITPAALKTEVTTDPLKLGYVVGNDGLNVSLLNSLAGVGAAMVTVQSMTRGQLLKGCIPFSDQLASGVDVNNVAISAAASQKWQFRLNALIGGDDVIQVDAALLGMLGQLVTDKLGTQAELDAFTKRTGSRAEVLWGAGTLISVAQLGQAMTGNS